MGPRVTFAPSTLKPIGGEPTGSGKWQSMPFSPKAIQSNRFNTKEYNKEWRKSDLEHQRELERARSARYRRRKRAATQTGAPA